VSNNPHAEVWTFPAAASPTSFSSSIELGAWDLVGFYAPAMETDTASLNLQTSEDWTISGFNTVAAADAAAKWVDVTDEDGNLVTLPCSAAAESNVRFANVSPFMRLGRCRLSAVQSDGSTAVTQDEQEVVPKLARVCG
jgi:hypothetical protein